MGLRATSRNGRGAFTLNELLVVMAVIAMLVGILVPVIGRAREQARQTQCRANLRQIGLAMELYREDFGAYTPPLYGWSREDNLLHLRATHTMFHQTDNHFSQGLLTQRVYPDNIVANWDRYYWGRNFIATGLGLLFRGGYMTEHATGGATIAAGSLFTCPSYPGYTHLKTSLTANEDGGSAIETKFAFDSKESFWTSTGGWQIAPANGNGIQDMNYPDGGPGADPSWQLGVLTTGYWLRQTDDYGSQTKPCWSSWDTKQSKNSHIALVSDMCGVRAGYNGYYLIDRSAPSLRDEFPAYDTGYTAGQRAGFYGFYIQNHDAGYNVLFADGSVKFFQDPTHDLLKQVLSEAGGAGTINEPSAAGAAALSNSRAVGSVMFRNFDTAYVQD